MMLRRMLLPALLLALGLVFIPGAFSSSKDADQLSKINHIVVIYEENHSFDNLYGGWEGVNGRSNATAANTTQVDQNGVAYGCLKQLDVNLTSPSPLATTCTDVVHAIVSAFQNSWFTIDNFIPATAKTCPGAQDAFAHPNGILNPLGAPGGCTRDLVHEFYQEQYQLNGGHQNRYMSGSDSAGTTMGVYDTQSLPIYKYLHEDGHPHYAIEDNFFQAAFGGSFLNHQWLIAAATPRFPGGGPSTLNSIVDSNGMPVAYPLYTPTGTVRRGPLTATCASLPAGVHVACGDDYAINTMRPPFQPSGIFGAQLTVPQTAPTIGDRLNTAHIDWAWYAGGWSNANGNVGGPGWTNGTGPTCSNPDTIVPSTFPYCANAVFQFHHQPFNYFAAFDPSTPAGLANRTAHLRDETEFMQAEQSSGNQCNLKPVSFVKPIGQENEHPGYASEPNGNDHLVTLIKGIENGACAKDTMVMVVYDEFGGQWDHVAPPGQGNNNGPHDQWGPGSRIAALVISPHLRGNFVVDSTEHDTTSVMATIEHRFGLAPMAANSRDAQVNDLSSIYDARQVGGD
jgi:acid phosphatase